MDEQKQGDWLSTVIVASLIGLAVGSLFVAILWIDWDRAKETGRNETLEFQKRLREAGE